MICSLHTGHWGSRDVFKRFFLLSIAQSCRWSFHHAICQSLQWRYREKLSTRGPPCDPSNINSILLWKRCLRHAKSQTVLAHPDTDLFPLLLEKERIISGTLMLAVLRRTQTRPPVPTNGVRRRNLSVFAFKTGVCGCWIQCYRLRCWTFAISSAVILLRQIGIKIATGRHTSLLVTSFQSKVTQIFFEQAFCLRSFIFVFVLGFFFGKYVCFGGRQGWNVWWV